MHTMRRFLGDARGPVAMFITLFLFFLLVSGKAETQHLVAGAVSAALITWYWRHLLRGLIHRHDILPYRVILCPNTLPYLIFLLVQIVKANISVAMVVLNPGLPISPMVLRTRTSLKRNLTRVMFAQSITLTPGTLTLNLTDDRLVIHSLTEEAGDYRHLDAAETRLAGIERRLM